VRGKVEITAKFACDVMLDDTPAPAEEALSPYLSRLNRELRERGSSPVRFVMFDLWPSLGRWTSRFLYLRNSAGADDILRRWLRVVPSWGTDNEIDIMMRSQKDLDLSQWEFESGETKVLPPSGAMYWHIGVKKPRINGY
jgi:hypothetical protein